MSNEIATITGHAIASTETLSEAARDAVLSALAVNTRRAYAAQLRLWEEHAAELGLPPYPASPTVVTNWLVQRATDGIPGARRAQAGRAGQTVGTLRTAVAALRWAHTAKGLSFNSKDEHLTKALAGLGRKRAEVTIQSKALTGPQLVAVLDGLGDDITSLRDAALLALGFAAARRRSEIVGLDLEVLGEGDGVLSRDAREFRVLLVRGKTVTGDEDPIIVSREDNPLAAQAVDRWIDAAQIKRGTAVYRRIRKGGAITADRLHEDYVARIVRSRIAEHLIRSGVSPVVAEEEARLYAGHSMRHGFATSAAEAGAPVMEIASVTGHKSIAILSRYTRQADRAKLRPGKRVGVGLRKEG